MPPPPLDLDRDPDPRVRYIDDTPLGCHTLASGLLACAVIVVVSLGLWLWR